MRLQAMTRLQAVRAGILAVLGALLTVGVLGCGPQRLQGVEATAAEVAFAAQELGRVIAHESAEGRVDAITAQRIVNFAVLADQTAHAAPLGWKASILTAWQGVKPTLPKITHPIVVAAIATLEALLAT